MTEQQICKITHINDLKTNTGLKNATYIDVIQEDGSSLRYEVQLAEKEEHWINGGDPYVATALLFGVLIIAFIVSLAFGRSTHKW